MSDFEKQVAAQSRLNRVTLNLPSIKILLVSGLAVAGFVVGMVRSSAVLSGDDLLIRVVTWVLIVASLIFLIWGDDLVDGIADIVVWMFFIPMAFGAGAFAGAALLQFLTDFEQMMMAARALELKRYSS